jgi:hypothetical protein
MKNMSIKKEYGKEYLPTIEAILSHKNKKESRAGILLDCRAQITLITEELLSKIKENGGLIEENEQIKMSGVG